MDLSRRHPTFEFRASGPDGARFLLVFDDGNFNEFETFLLTDWIAHTPPEGAGARTSMLREPFANSPKKELFIFCASASGALADEQQAAEGGNEERCRIASTSSQARWSRTRRRRAAKSRYRRIAKIWPATRHRGGNW